MGVGLPLVATTYFFYPKKKVVVICGDGGFI
jgi:thiamine pyrophosphate-dependent acetolactate synthase large subunit-like protein